MGFQGKRGSCKSCLLVFSTLTLLCLAPSNNKKRISGKEIRKKIGTGEEMEKSGRGGPLTTLLEMYLGNRKYTFLNVAKEELGDIGPEIGLVTQLETLALQDSQITSLPPEIGTFSIFPCVAYTLLQEYFGFTNHRSLNLISNRSSNPAKDVDSQWQQPDSNPN